MGASRSRTGTVRSTTNCSSPRLSSTPSPIRESRYRLRAGPLLEIQQWVAQYERYWDDRLESLRRYVESNPEDK